MYSNIIQFTNDTDQSVKRSLFTYFQDKRVRSRAIYLQKILKCRILLRIPVVLCGVHRYTQDMFDQGHEQNRSGYRIQFPAKLRPFQFISAKPKDSDECTSTEHIRRCKINRLQRNIAQVETFDSERREVFEHLRSRQITNNDIFCLQIF